MFMDCLAGLVIGLLIGGVWGWFLRRRRKATDSNKQLETSLGELEVELGKLKALSEERVSDQGAEAEALARLETVVKNADNRLKMLEQSLQSSEEDEIDHNHNM